MHQHPPAGIPAHSGGDPVQPPTPNGLPALHHPDDPILFVHPFHQLHAPHRIGHGPTVAQGKAVEEDENEVNPAPAAATPACTARRAAAAPDTRAAPAAPPSPPRRTPSPPHASARSWQPAARTRLSGSSDDLRSLIDYVCAGPGLPRRLVAKARRISEN